MSLLSRFLRRRRRERWYIKVDLITELADIARSRWRREWVTLVGRARPDVDDPLTAGPASRASENALIRLQLETFSESIRKQSYLAEDEVDSFLRFLATRMGGGTLGTAGDAMAALPAADETLEALLFTTAEAVAGELASGSTAARERIERTLDLFRLEQEYVAALAFDDRASAQRLKARIEATDLGPPLEI